METILETILDIKQTTMPQIGIMPTVDMIIISIILDIKTVLEEILDIRWMMIFHLGLGIMTTVYMIMIINRHSIFVKINTVIVLEKKCIVMETVRTGWIKIAKKLVESAFQVNHSWKESCLRERGELSPPGIHNMGFDNTTVPDSYLILILGRLQFFFKFGVLQCRLG